MNILFFIFTLLFASLAYFFGTELLKKFRFWKNFQEKHTNQISWKYEGNKKPGMYTLEIRGKKSFRALIGFDFSIGIMKNVGYDVFGFMESDDDNTIQFSTYLGEGGVELIFLIDGIDARSLEIICHDKTNTKVSYVHKPHWYQKIGFFG